MKDLQNIIKSFHLQENLNSKIWKNTGGEPKMDSKVREKLLEIANEFIEYLKVDIIVSDVIMTGSLANFNWSEYSDIDLHVIADFTQFPKEDLPLYEELFKLKKTLFNEKHNIKIYGYEVELYVQNEEESHFSSGVYSVLTDEWLTKPKKEDVTIDTELVKSKVKEWMNKIDTVIQNVENEPLDRAKILIDKLKDKIKKYRTSGLQKGGEYSDENLVFKSLRRNGYIEKLFDFEIKHVDKELSLKEGLFDSFLNNDVDTKIELSKKSTFLEELKKIAESGKEFKNLKKSGSKIPYQKEVEFIQTGLQFLGYSLPKWGIDGLFGPETESATKKLQKDYNLNVTGIFDEKTLKYLYSVLVSKDFSDDDLSKIQKQSDFSQISVGTNKQFYEEILKGIGAPITDENLKFFYAWRKAEGGKATNNPFNTTMNLKSDINKTNYNKIGVKNYSTPQYGVESTVKTLLNGRYSCIVNGLKNDIGSEEISRCSDLKTWGTGELVAKVIDSGKLNPPPIYA
jgi:peptidoglycan hydrolase-like protein with peptidoglycan-binding domain/predicted nucleotidyltransferase